MGDRAQEGRRGEKEGEVEDLGGQGIEGMRHCFLLPHKYF